MNDTTTFDDMAISPVFRVWLAHLAKSASQIPDAELQAAISSIEISPIVERWLSRLADACSVSESDLKLLANKPGAWSIFEAWTTRLAQKCTFPPDELANRLNYMGVLELFEGTADAEAPRNFDHGLPDGSPLALHGFPSRFYGVLDEAISALAYFLDKFKRAPGSTLNIYAIHVPPKGNESDLSMWQCSKAKLYLDLQYLILLLGRNNDRKKAQNPRIATIERYFVFKTPSDAAYLSQAAAAAIAEQSAMGIKTRIMLADSQCPDEYTNTLAIEYLPTTDGERDFNAYMLREERSPARIEVGERFASKWYSTVIHRTDLTAPNEIGDFIWRFKNRKNFFSGFDPFEVYHDPNNPFSLPTYNAIPYALYKAYREKPNIYRNETERDFVLEQISKEVISSDIFTLQRAIEEFSVSPEIFAVDCTAGKNTLAVHETTPRYRHWMRSSLNNVLKSTGSEFRLNRIYIIDDTTDNGLSSTKGVLQLFLNHFRHSFANDLSPRADPCSETAQRGDSRAAENERVAKNWEDRGWRRTSPVDIRITTFSALDRLNGVLAKQMALPETARRFKQLMGVVFQKDVGNNPWYYLRYLDFLFTSEMLYDFRNPSGDPSGIHFEADMYRKTCDVNAEVRRISPSTGGEHHDTFQKHLIDARILWVIDFLKRTCFNTKNEITREIGKLARAAISRDLQTLHIKDDGAWDTLEDKLKEHFGLSQKDNTEELLMKLLNMKLLIEKSLFDLLYPAFSYLYKILKHCSLNIDFFGNPEVDDINCVEPFLSSETTDSLNEKIVMSCTPLGKDLLPHIPNIVLTSQPRRKSRYEFDVFLCHNSKDHESVEEIARLLELRELRPWLDEWELAAGSKWRRKLEADIRKSKSAAVFFGSSNIGPWQARELDAFFEEFDKPGRRLIPVFLKDVAGRFLQKGSGNPKLPFGLKGTSIVDFRKSEPDPLEQLICGITGKRPPRRPR